MFADNGKISKRQLAIQMMLSFGGVFLLVLPGQEGFAGREGIFALAVGYVGFCIYLFFLMRLAGPCREPLRITGKLAGGLAAIFYGLILTVTAAWLLQQMADIGSGYLVEGADENLLVLLLLAVAALGTGKDIQRRGRLGEAIFPIISAALILFLLLALFQGDSAYLMEVETVTVKGILEKGWLVFSMISLMGVMPFLLGRVDRYTGASGKLRVSMGAVFLFLGANLLLLRAVFGQESIGHKKFPMADLMAGTSLPGGFLQRLDILWITVLILSLLFAVGSLLFYAGDVLGRFGIPYCRVPVLVVTGFLALPAVTDTVIVENYLLLLTRVGAPVLLVFSLGMSLMGRREA